MLDFIRNINLDRISFWLGFLAGAIAFFLLGKLRRVLSFLQKRLKAQAIATREELSRSNEIRLSNDTLKLAQTWHLAAPLFSLDEILVPPYLLAPPPAPTPGALNPSDDITEWVIPYLPDWPELGSYYNAPRFSLAEALRGGANIAVIGQPGTGKTVALAHLAVQLIRGEAETQPLGELVPILVQAADLVLPPRDPENPLITLYDAISTYAGRLTMARLPKLIGELLEEKRALLLVDGMDELAPAQLDEVAQYLGALLEKYPGLRAVVSASPDYMGSIAASGFVPIPMASWNQAQRAEFLKRWSEMWSRYVSPLAPDKKEAVQAPPGADPQMVAGWLLPETALLTPFELTLKVWAAYAGDSLGPDSIDAIEAHLRRLFHNRPAKCRAAAEFMAFRMAMAMQPVTEHKNAEGWLAGTEAAGDQAESAEESKGAVKERVRIPGALSDLVDCGLVTEHFAERVSLMHPIFLGYLAGQGQILPTDSQALVEQPDWTGKIQALHYLATRDGRDGLVSQLLVDEHADPLMRGLFNASRWLRDAGETLPWATQVLRQLAGSLQKENLPFSIKARAITALALSGNSGVAVLMKQLLSAPKEEMRQLAALGLGILRDNKAASDISHLVGDRSPLVGRAAILALVAIGDKFSLEAVAYVLLHADEGMRRAAAEGLANHPEEGHPTLEEGSAVEDPAVRRAAVFGLGRIRQPWSNAILDKLRTEDKQWVVQDAAATTLDAITHMDPHTPHPLPALTHTPWLIDFAGERGIGVAPGKPAQDLLFLCLKEGKEEQRLAVIYYLSLKGDEKAVMPLYQIYYSDRGDLREAALCALWHLGSAGVPLPPPAQFDYK